MSRIASIALLLVVSIGTASVLTGCTAFSISDTSGKKAPGVPIYAYDTYLFVTQTESKDAQGKTSTAYAGEIKQIRNTSKVLFYVNPEPVVQGKLSLKWGADGQLTEINGESDTKAAEIIKAVTDAIPNLAKLFGAGAGIASEGPQPGFAPLVYKLQEDGTWKKVTIMD